MKSATFQSWVWTGWLGLALVAAGQGIRTPARSSWTEDGGTAVTISWDTPEQARGTVRYGLTSNYTQTVCDGGGLYRHAIPLSGLQPGTRYFFEATSTDGYAQTGTFRTAPVSGTNLHFVLQGDLNGGVSVPWATTVADMIVQEDPDWVVQLGDLSDEAYGGAGFDTWTNFFSICETELSKAVFMPIPGNHDDPSIGPISAHERGYYHRLFALPSPSLGVGNYAYTAGNIRFICLNSEADPSLQNEWLARELQAAANDTNIVWIMSTCHRPPYSWGERESSLDIRTNWAELWTRYEADWVISGHSHNYQRTIPIRGVHYLITGCAGASPYDSAVGESSLLFATTCYHHVSCHVTNDVMQVRGIRSDGRIFDTAVVTNRRQVRVEPAFPLRGEPAKIVFRSTEGPLAAANPVYIHIGQDEFASAFASEPMTWNAASQRWEYEFTVPLTATNRLAFLFHDGTGTWYKINNEYNWQALLGRASLSPAVPAAGSNATLRYEADMGPLAGASYVTAWLAADGAPFTSTGQVELAWVSGARWEGTVPLPADASRLKVAFSSDTGWDDDALRNWNFPLAAAAPPAYGPAPIAAVATPVVTDSPVVEGERNNIGDNFDLAQLGPPVRQEPGPYGFGDWGSIWFNQDETNLYVGAMGVDMAGSNNVMVMFLGLDTLSDNAWNLWHKTGPPNTLDYLHNIRFTEPMDLALVLGDQYGDGGSFTNFVYGGYDFGQGVYYIGTNSSDFYPVPGVRLSQFDGEGTTPCATPWDTEHRQTMRWEVAIPWSSLDASPSAPASNLFVCGVFASAGVSNSDRYLSRTVIGEHAWGDRDAYGQFAYNTAIFRPLRVNLPHADLVGDGLPNDWRQEYFGTPLGPPADEDSDGDGQTNAEEEAGGTHPLDGDSFFKLEDGTDPLNWGQIPARVYDIEYTTNLFVPFVPLAMGLMTNRYIPQTSGYFRVRVRK